MIYIIRGLEHYFPPMNSLSEQKCAMHRIMKEPYSLTARQYVAYLIDLNEYLASLLGATLTDNIGVTELNQIFLNSMPIRWSKQAYVQGFDCESIIFKKAVNMFDRMEISELGRHQP